ncbi:MAG TPA: MoxR family ATPase [Polyangiales bacterium]
MTEALTELAASCERVLNEAQKVVVGQRKPLESMLIALLAQGHALLEGVPGTAKTLMVRALSSSLGLTSGRIQFTPDLMPSDIVGTHVFDLAQSSFHLRKGPIFTELLLADEINRAPAKTQSALLEAMQERQVSIDGEVQPLPEAFTVFATQNPIDHEGTYPLPEAELDRFLFKIRVDYPTPDEEDEILRRATASVTSIDPRAAGVHEALTRTQLTALRALAGEVRVDEAVRRYARDLVRSTRTSPQVLRGAGPRAGVHLLVAARWSALLAGRQFVTPDDVQRMLPEVLSHRLTLSTEAELDGLSPQEVLRSLVSELEVPR